MLTAAAAEPQSQLAIDTTREKIARASREKEEANARIRSELRTCCYWGPYGPDTPTPGASSDKDRLLKRLARATQLSALYICSSRALQKREDGEVDFIHERMNIYWLIQ